MNQALWRRPEANIQNEDEDDKMAMTICSFLN
jgi:hypothetical protein